MNTWFTIQDQQVKLTIFAKPHGSKTAIMGINEQGLQISIHAAPQKGEANKELIAYLSDLFDAPKKQIILLRGETSKYKQVIMPLTKKLIAYIEKNCNLE